MTHYNFFVYLGFVLFIFITTPVILYSVFIDAYRNECIKLGIEPSHVSFSEFYKEEWLVLIISSICISILSSIIVFMIIN